MGDISEGGGAVASDYTNSEVASLASIATQSRLGAGEERERMKHELKAKGIDYRPFAELAEDGYTVVVPVRQTSRTRSIAVCRTARGGYGWTPLLGGDEWRVAPQLVTIPIDREFESFSDLMDAAAVEVDAIDRLGVADGHTKIETLIEYNHGVSVYRTKSGSYKAMVERTWLNFWDRAGFPSFEEARLYAISVTKRLDAHGDSPHGVHRSLKPGARVPGWGR